MSLPTALILYIGFSQITKCSIRALNTLLDSVCKSFTTKLPNLWTHSAFKLYLFFSLTSLDWKDSLLFCIWIVHYVLLFTVSYCECCRSLCVSAILVFLVFECISLLFWRTSTKKKELLCNWKEVYSKHFLSAKYQVDTSPLSIDLSLRFLPSILLIPKLPYKHSGSLACILSFSSWKASRTFHGSWCDSSLLSAFCIYANTRKPRTYNRWTPSQLTF